MEAAAAPPSEDDSASLRIYMHQGESISNGHQLAYPLDATPPAELFEAEETDKALATAAAVINP